MTVSHGAVLVGVHLVRATVGRSTQRRRNTVPATAEIPAEQAGRLREHVARRRGWGSRSDDGRGRGGHGDRRWGGARGAGARGAGARRAGARRCCVIIATRSTQEIRPDEDPDNQQRADCADQVLAYSGRLTMWLRCLLRD